MDGVSETKKQLFDEINEDFNYICNRKHMTHREKCIETRFLNKLKSISGVNEEMMGKGIINGSSVGNKRTIKRNFS